MARGRLRLAALVVLIAGLALAVGLVVHFGARAVGAALSTAGISGLLLVSAVHLVATLFMGLAWWVLLEGRTPAPPWAFMWARMMRDAGAEALPLSQVGGYVLGARALLLRGIGGAMAAASTIADVTVELSAQIAYTALGAAMLLWLRPQTTFTVPLLAGLVAAVLVVIAFVIVQRRGAGLLDRLTARIAGDWVAALAAGAEAVQAEIRAIYARPAALWACFFLHFLAWLESTVEVWLALRLMGAPIGILPALAIESLLYAIRSIAFAVPNAIGVQEGAYVMLGATFGVSPEVALGLSLLKRGRDLLLAIPALLAWQFLETRRLLRSKAG